MPRDHNWFVVMRFFFLSHICSHCSSVDSYVCICVSVCVCKAVPFVILHYPNLHTDLIPFHLCTSIFLSICCFCPCAHLHPFKSIYTSSEIYYLNYNLIYVICYFTLFYTQKERSTLNQRNNNPSSWCIMFITDFCCVYQKHKNILGLFSYSSTFSFWFGLLYFIASFCVYVCGIYVGTEDWFPMTVSVSNAWAAYIRIAYVYVEEKYTHTFKRKRASRE